MNFGVHPPALTVGAAAVGAVPAAGGVTGPGLGDKWPALYCNLFRIPIPMSNRIKKIPMLIPNLNGVILGFLYGVVGVGGGGLGADWTTFAAAASNNMFGLPTIVVVAFILSNICA